jgi:predicted CXXCH cytochrome family protein
MNNRNYFRPVLILSLFIVYGFILISGAGLVHGKPQLKANMDKICLNCHPELKKELAEGKAHKPCESNDCITCHSPHVAQNDDLLMQKGEALCSGCHESTKIWLNREVVHLPVEYGECLKCHDPHLSIYQSLLRFEENQMCFQCHDPLSFQKKNIHQPVKEGRCTNCHQVHSSDTPFLLTQSSPKICYQCHPLNQKLISAHPLFRINEANCLLCHNPHSSDEKNLVYSIQHDPFLKNNCKECHPVSSGLVKPATGDAENCYKCHKDSKERFDQKEKSHIVSGPRECIFCHNPHGAERNNLVRRGDRSLCTACHEEIGKRLRIVRKGLRRHPEVIAGRCSICHDSHSSDDINFLREPPLIFCTVCHKRQKVACHPVGHKALDPRTKTPIDCITCHNPMEAEFPNIMRLDGSKELCNQCHKY